LYDETYENYKSFLNPPLARVMKLSGSPVEVRASGTTIWDHTGKAYLDFAGGYGVFTLGHAHPRVVAAVRAQLDRDGALGKDDVRSVARAARARAGGD
jgi:putrescine aminotransferase